jgi:uncharacterized protein (TIGR00730 family)
MMKRICIFCGSNRGKAPAYSRAAHELGVALTDRGLGLVYGGGNVGLMGVVADAVLERGGHAVGVIPQALVDKELGHQGLSELRIVHSMHERKALMAELADAFIALPGGYGTLEEFCEIITWAQLGLHAKPFGLLNVEGFYDPFLSQIDRGVKEGFIPLEHRSLIVVGNEPGPLIDRVLQFKPPKVPKWIAPDEI